MRCWYEHRDLGENRQQPPSHELALSAVDGRPRECRRIRPPLSLEMSMIQIFLTFIVTTCLYGCFLFLACRRVARHLQGNQEAVKAVTEHVLLPMLGRQGEQHTDGGADEEDAG